MKRFSFSQLLPVFACTTMLLANYSSKVKDYLTIPGPIQLNKAAYLLSWSSHPSKVYYKQEYLPAGQKVETFTRMVIVEVLVDPLSVQQAAENKMNELLQRKKSDTLCTYRLVETTQAERLLAFTLSHNAGLTNGIVESNVYRYTRFKDRSGKTGLLLLGISWRAYGKNKDSFVKSLPVDQTTYLNAIKSYLIPTIKIVE